MAPLSNAGCSTMFPSTLDDAPCVRKCNHSSCVSLPNNAEDVRRDSKSLGVVVVVVVIAIDDVVAVVVVVVIVAVVTSNKARKLMLLKISWSFALSVCPSRNSLVTLVSSVIDATVG